MKANQVHGTDVLYKNRREFKASVHTPKWVFHMRQGEKRNSAASASIGGQAFPPKQTAAAGFRQKLFKISV
ncbi:hypothetical protein DCC62_32660 [candidate division KSB1 bacterium]|nr:MAG: hypothetical protein DCC62_32660 [candidate division KSB1 bacterium]